MDQKQECVKIVDTIVDVRHRLFRLQRFAKAAAQDDIPEIGDVANTIRELQQNPETIFVAFINLNQIKIARMKDEIH